jgi:hypothetical protein
MLCLLVGCSAPASVPPAVDATPTSAPPAALTTPASIPPTVAPTSPPASTPTTAPTGEARTDGLSDEEAATLSSLEQVDDYPLFTMHYHGPYEQRMTSIDGLWGLASANPPSSDPTASPSAWACSLFAAMGDAEDMLYGRNFDWEYSPAVLLFTDPLDGYASVSMVDIAYLGFGGTSAGRLPDLPLVERRALLDAPRMPFDGMNEHGLVVGMAAVPPGQMRPDPDKETIDFEGGPPLHYLVADPSGRSVLIEFYQGEMVMMPNETPWHLATNFLRASVGESTAGQCWRYDRISQRLTDAQGQMTTPGATQLLSDVSQEGTQWSIIYGMSTGDVSVMMGRQYDTPHTFHLGLAGE